MASVKFWNYKTQQHERAEIFDSLNEAIRETEREFRQIPGEYHEPGTYTNDLGINEDGHGGLYNIYKIHAAARMIENNEVDENIVFVAVTID